jgi:hypothetical protein
MLVLFLLASPEAGAQCTFGTANCTAIMTPSTSVNFNTLSWTNVSGPACPTGGSTSYTGNLSLNMSNNTNLTVTTDFTVTGDFKLTNAGSSSVLIIPVGVTLHVTGNLGDCSNNNVDYVVNGSLIVDGFLSGRNNNTFSGTGSVTAGGLNFNNNTVCTAPCNINWNVGTCSAAGAAGATFCALPISLISFQAEARVDGIHVRWVTESESHVDYVTLQKSSDGVDFYPVADFPGQGDTRESRTYAFLDEHPIIGKAYYRLRETDLDGAVLYHRIISVDYSGGRMLDLYPVPVSDGLLNLRTNFYTGTDSRVIISDVMGTVLQVAVLRSGEEMKLPIELMPGIYVLTFTNGDFRSVKRFVVR